MTTISAASSSHPESLLPVEDPIVSVSDKARTTEGISLSQATEERDARYLEQGFVRKGGLWVRSLQINPATDSSEKEGKSQGSPMSLLDALKTLTPPAAQKKNKE